MVSSHVINVERRGEKSPTLELTAGVVRFMPSRNTADLERAIILLPLALIRAWVQGLVYPKAQNSPKALHIMAFGPKSLKI